MLNQTRTDLKFYIIKCLEKDLKMCFCFVVYGKVHGNKEKEQSLKYIVNVCTYYMYKSFDKRQPLIMLYMTPQILDSTS